MLWTIFIFRTWTPNVGTRYIACWIILHHKKNEYQTTTMKKKSILLLYLKNASFMFLQVFKLMWMVLTQDHKGKITLSSFWFRKSNLILEFQNWGLGPTQLVLFSMQVQVLRRFAWCPGPELDLNWTSNTVYLTCTNSKLGSLKSSKTTLFGLFLNLEDKVEI